MTEGEVGIKETEMKFLILNDYNKLIASRSRCFGRGQIRISCFESWIFCHKKHEFKNKGTDECLMRDQKSKIKNPTSVRSQQKPLASPHIVCPSFSRMYSKSCYRWGKLKDWNPRRDFTPSWKTRMVDALTKVCRFERAPINFTS